MTNTLLQSLIIRRDLMNAGYKNIVVENSDTIFPHRFFTKHIRLPQNINSNSYIMVSIISEYALELIEMHIKDKSTLSLPLPDLALINPFGEILEPIKINLSL
jgi:hypothetical protein